MKKKKVKFLLNEGYKNFGMLQEAKMKCLMLKNKIKEKNINENQIKIIKIQIKKIQKDITKYSKKIFIINNKLKKIKGIS